MSTATVTQPIRQYVDASEWADGIFWIDVKYVTGNVRLYLETSMTDEESYFTPLVNYVSTTGTSMLISRFSSAVTPIMRFIRWKMQNGTDWSITFRIYAVFKNS